MRTKTIGNMGVVQSILMEVKNVTNKTLAVLTMSRFFNSAKRL